MRSDFHLYLERLPTIRNQYNRSLFHFPIYTVFCPGFTYPDVTFHDRAVMPCIAALLQILDNQVLAVGAYWFDFSDHHRPPPMHEKVWVFGAQNPELSLHSGVRPHRPVSVVSKYGSLETNALAAAPDTVCFIILPIFKYPLQTMRITLPSLSILQGLISTSLRVFS